MEEVLPAGEVNPIGHFKHSFNNKSLYKYSPARQVVGIVIENVGLGENEGVGETPV